MIKRATILLGTVLSWVISVSAQRTINERGQYTPTPEEAAFSERMRELLANPTLIRLRLTFLDPNTDQETTVSPLYRLEDHIVIALILSHSFNEAIRFSQPRDPFTDVRLKLIRDGEKIPLIKEAQRRTQRGEAEPPTDSIVSAFLPGKDYRLLRLDLQQWYGTLPAGQYQLTIRRRFVFGGAWVESDPITFNIH